MRLEIHGGWLKGIQQCLSPNYDHRPANQKISLLVIHNISLPPNEFGGGYVHDFFQNKLKCNAHPYFEKICMLRVSAHCLIERDGHISQFVSFDNRAWHAGASHYEGRESCNDFSIGIELEGSDEIPYTKTQYQRLALLTKAIMKKYPAITTERICGHSDIASERKTDPGPAFDWVYYKSLLK